MGPMVRADVKCVHLLPRSAQHTLVGTPNAQVDGASGYCWVQDSSSILIWPYADGQGARVKRLQLPADPQGNIWVSVLRHPSTPVVTVIACTLDGLLCIWFDIDQLAGPVCQQVLQAPAAAAGDSIAVYAFHATSAPTGTNPGFVATMAAVDGGLYFIQGAPAQALTIRQLPTRTEQAAAAGGGMLGTLASVVKSVYAEAFDPYKQFNRSTPASLAALQLAIVPAGAFKWKLFVLTPETLDCWLVSIGVRTTETLQWSHLLLAAAQRLTCAQDLHLLAMQLAPDASTVHVWTAGGPPQHHPLHQAQAGQGPLYSLLWCSVAGGDIAPYQWSVDSFGLDVATEQPAPEDAPLCRLVVDPAHHTGLLSFPAGAVYQWEEGRGSARQLVASGDLAAVSAAPLAAASSAVAATDNAAQWLLLSASYGVLEIGPDDGDDGGAAGGEGAGPDGPLSAEQEQQVGRVLEAAVVQAARGGAPLRLGRRLRALGALRGPQSMGVLERAAVALVDAVPKHWDGEGGGMGAGVGVVVGEQLQEKAEHLAHLLSALDSAQVLPLLLQHSPQVLRTMWDAAEQLAAVAAIWQLHFWQAAGQQVPPAGAELVGEVVEGTGVVLQSTRFQQLKDWEVFYAAPTLSAPAFFQALEETAAGVLAGLRDQSVDGLAGLRMLEGLVAVVQASTGAATERREQLQAEFPAVASQLCVGAPQATWLVGAAPRAALERLFEVADALRTPPHRQRLRGEPDGQRIQLAVYLADTLLSAHAAALAPLDPSGAARSALAAKLASLRSLCLPPLLDEAGVALAGAEDPESEAAASAMDLLREVSRLAEVHTCHEVLFGVEEVLQRAGGGGRELRAQHMRDVGPPEGAPPSDTYTAYVFQRLLDDGRRVELLESPEEFRPQLRAFLQPHPVLLQLLLKRTGDFAAAAACLFDLANNTPDLGERVRHMSAAKLCALGSPAATLPARGEILQRAEDALRLIQIQMALGLGEEAALAPLQLVDAALARPAGAGAGAGGLMEDGAGPAEDGGWSAGALAVAALAMQPAKAAGDIRTRWEAAWRHTVAGCSGSGGGGEGGAAALQQVPVYQAARACLGRPVFGQVGGMTDSEPVRQVRAWLQEWCGDDPGKARVVLDAFALALGEAGYEEEVVLMAE